MDMSASCCTGTCAKRLRTTGGRRGLGGRGRNPGSLIPNYSTVPRRTPRGQTGKVCGCEGDAKPSREPDACNEFGERPSRGSDHAAIILTTFLDSAGHIATQGDQEYQGDHF